jgi:hypothetical protein
MQSKPADETVVTYKSPQGSRVTQVRGSLIASSLSTLRARELFERYESLLEPEYREQVLYCVAASWLPIEVAMAHYRACEAMGVSDRELDALGNEVSKRIMGTFLATMVRSARHVGSSIPLRQYPRLWERLLIGGSCNVHLFGPKDARIESYGVPMFSYRYFRVGYAGLVRGASLLFRTASHVRIRNASADSLVLDLSWV